MILSQYKDKYFFSKRTFGFFCLVVVVFSTVLINAQQYRYLPPESKASEFLQPWLRGSENSCLSGISRVSAQLKDFEYSFQADKSDIKLSAGTSSFEGNVVWQREEDVLRTEYLDIHRNRQGDITQWAIPGELTWSNDGLHMQAQSAAYKKDEGYSAREILFLLFGDHHRRLWGWSEDMRAKDTDNIVFYNIFMSSCTPDAMGWHVEAPEVAWDAHIQRLRMLNPRFYYFNTYLFSFNYYDVYMRKAYHAWLPKFDYVNGVFRFGLQYQQQYASWRLFPYVNSRGNIGVQISDLGVTEHGSSKGDVDIFYKFNSKDVSWRLYHRGLRHLSLGDLDWQFLWKNNANTVSASDESIRPNQSLANHFRYVYADDVDDAELGLYWFKRFSQMPKWSIDANGLSNYDRLPHLYRLHNPEEGLSWGLVYDNLIFLSNPDDVPTASRGLMYLGYNTSWELPYAMYAKTSIGSWYSVRHLYDDYSFAKNRSALIPRFKTTLWLLKDALLHAGLDYYYVARNTEQLAGPIFTQNRWYWRNTDKDLLQQVDLIADKNDVNVFAYWPRLFGLDSVQLKLSHALPLASHKVYLSSTGDEDPQVHYKNKITYGMLRRSDGKAKLEGLWNWKLGKWHTIHLHVQHGGWQFYWLEEPGLLLKEDTGYDFSNARLIGLAFPLYRNGPDYVYAKLNYTDNANKNLYYKFGWEYNSCCMHMALEVSKNQIITGDNLQKYRWPAVALRFSVTGW